MKNNIMIMAFILLFIEIHLGILTKIMIFYKD
jgi:hypothetical protein